MATTNYQVNFWPLHNGLAQVSDATGSFLCHPDELETVLREVEGSDCVSVCSNGECAGFYVYRAGQQPYCYTYQGAVNPNL